MAGRRKKQTKGKKKQLTTISAMTRGCLSGRRRNASNRVSASTMHICIIKRGSAWWRGLSPWKTPFEVAFIGGKHVAVVFEAILQQNHKEQGPKRLSQYIKKPEITDEHKPKHDNMLEFKNQPVQRKQFHLMQHSKTKFYLPPLTIARIYVSFTQEKGPPNENQIRKINKLFIHV